MLFWPSLLNQQLLADAPAKTHFGWISGWGGLATVQHSGRWHCSVRLSTCCPLLSSTHAEPFTSVDTSQPTLSEAECEQQASKKNCAKKLVRNSLVNIAIIQETGKKLSRQYCNHTRNSHQYCNHTKNACIKQTGSKQGTRHNRRRNKHVIGARQIDNNNRLAIATNANMYTLA